MTTISEDTQPSGTTPGGIAGFLLARIAEDESVARYALSRDDGGALDYGGQWFGAVEHARRWEPTRVLAECEAKRSIVGICQEGIESDMACQEGHSWGFEGTLQHLAAVYSEHPDYDESWRP